MPALLIGALLAQAVSNQECPSLIARARASYEAKRFDSAAIDFGQAAKLCSPKPALLLGLGQSELMLQKFAEAIDTFNQTIALDPNNAAAMKLRGDALYLLGKEPEAEKSFRDALSADPANQAAHYALGRMFYQQSRYPEAAAEFGKVIEADPKSYRALDNLALCYEALNQDDLALKTYFRALDLVYKDHPEYDWVYANLANFFLGRGQNEKAFQLAAEAAKRNPKSARNFFLTGKALSKLDKTEQSVRWLQQAERLDPDYPEPRYLLAQIYRKQGKTEDADRELKSFRELNGKPRPRR